MKTRLLLGLISLSCWSGRAELTGTPREDFWIPDGPVRALVETNGVLYVGGQFTYLSPTSETGGAFDANTGVALADFPRFDGLIRAVVPDHSGGWFVGGQFESVSGVPIRNLVHLLPNLTLDAHWTPNPDGAVFALAISADRLFVGGTYHTIAGEPHDLLAALHPVTGDALPWHADCASTYADASVNALVLAEGRLYVGGYFITINQVEREHLASLDAETGEVTEWFPNGHVGPESTSRVDALAFRDGTLIVGGTFATFGGLHTNGPVRPFLAALDVTKNLGESVLDWNPSPDAPVSALAVSCDRVFAAGAFRHLGAVAREHLAAIDLVTGQPTPWDPAADADVLAMTLVGDSLYVGGKFTLVSGQNREYAASLDIHSGVATPWKPRADFGVSALAAAGKTVVAGGTLGAGGKPRRNLAAFDARSGQPLDWAPQVLGSTQINAAPIEGITALTVSADCLYLGGNFTEVNGQTRNRLAAIRVADVTLSDWNPGSDGPVSALAYHAGHVYVGGRFASVGGTPRTNFAVVHALTGVTEPWAPNPDEKVTALIVGEDRLYVGGRFTRFGGEARKRLVAVSLTSGELSPWQVDIDDEVSTGAAIGSTLFFGGFFQTAGPTIRHHAASLESTTGLTGCWDPAIEQLSPAGPRSAGLHAVTILEGTAYLGGHFNSVAGQNRAGLAAVSVTCPTAVAAWNPGPDALVEAMTVAHGSLAVGGGFHRIADQPRQFLAVFAPAGSPRILVQPTNQFVSVGGNAILAPVAEGRGPLAFQWWRNGVPLPGAASGTLTIPNAQLANTGEYTLVVTNDLGLARSRTVTLTIGQPAQILAQPRSATPAPGESLTLTVVASGGPEPTYQWRLNGVNLPGAVSSTLTLTNLQPADGGSYDVVVANLVGTVHSDVATVRVQTPRLSLADAVADRGHLAGATGTGSGSNLDATPQRGEPHHVGKPGGRSVWVDWIAPQDGIARFTTRGSTFDTLLGIYTGSGIDDLGEVAADEDHGGFLTSEVVFNATRGTTYLIAVDGFAGAAGDIVLHWTLDTTVTPFPRILSEPVSQTAFTGEDVLLSVAASSLTPLTYQWYFACRPIPNATNASLRIPNVEASRAGGYYVVVRNDSAQAAESAEAFLEIGPSKRALTRDKAQDLFALPSADRFANKALANHVNPETLGFTGFLPVAAGSLQSQIFENLAASTQLGEPSHCGVLGGASQWFGLQAAEDGVLIVDTLGSSFATVVAVYASPLVYTDPFTFWSSLQLLTCDDGSAGLGGTSVASLPTKRDANYLIAVDGVNGARGLAHLNWQLIVPPPSVPTPATQLAGEGGEVRLRSAVPLRSRGTRFQWRFNSSPIPEATNDVFVLPRLGVAQAGEYSVVIQNESGATTNVMARLVVASLGIARGTPDHGSEIRLSVRASAPVQLEASQDLAIWSSVSTSTQVEKDFVWIDDQPQALPSTFYRLRLVRP